MEIPLTLSLARMNRVVPILAKVMACAFPPPKMRGTMRPYLPMANTTIGR